MEDLTVPDISPIYGGPRGLPPVLLIVGRTDLLLENNLAMAVGFLPPETTENSGSIPRRPHGCSAHPIEMARTALSKINSWLFDRLAHQGLPRKHTSTELHLGPATRRSSRLSRRTSGSGDEIRSTLQSKTNALGRKRVIRPDSPT